MTVGCKSGSYEPKKAEKASLGSVVPHPIPYQGSKRNLAEVILSYFPPKSKRIVEPFAGSAAISLAAAARGMAKRFVLNDAHEPLAGLWREILHQPDRLANDYEDLWHQQLGREKDFYNEVREEFNRTHRPACFLYLLARCVKAAIRYNSSGEFNNSPDNRRKGALPSSMRKRIKGAAKLLGADTIITAADYSKVLRSSRVGDLIYMDPPYQGVCGNKDSRYAPRVEHEAFCEQLILLNQKQHLYVVSYDGRMGSKTYGEPMPKSLQLFHIEINAGRSSQATLLGRDSDTYESLYLSPALASLVRERLRAKKEPSQTKLFES